MHGDQQVALSKQMYGFIWIAIIIFLRLVTFKSTEVNASGFGFFVMLLYLACVLTAHDLGCPQVPSTA